MDVDTPAGTPAGTPAAPADSTQITPDTLQRAPDPPPLVTSPSAGAAASPSESVFAEGRREIALLEDVLSAFQRLNGRISQNGGRFGVNMDRDDRSRAVDIIYEQIPNELNFLRGAYERGGGAEEQRMDELTEENEEILNDLEDETPERPNRDEIRRRRRRRVAGGSNLQIIKSLRL